MDITPVVPTGAKVSALERFLPPLAGIALGVVFLIAAAAKGGDPAAFAEQVEAHGIVSGALATAVAYILVPVEAVLGAALLLGLYRRAAAAGSAALLLFFIAVTAYAWSQGNTEGCGCFGSLAPRTPGQVITEDILLICLALIASLPWRSLLTRAGIRRRIPLRALAVILCGAGAIAYEVAAPSLPIDDYVTALRPGRPAEALGLDEQLEGDPPHLVALLDLKGEGIEATVAALNELASDPNVPPTIAFAAATESERGEFFWTSLPAPAPRLPRLRREGGQDLERWRTLV
jgi:uncharacterized membrane protein YphA (DoxX/SURF4 family)